MKEYLAERLKIAMSEKQMSYTKLGDAAKVHPTSIGLYRDGRAIPRADTLHRMAKALDVSMDWLYGND